MATLTIHLDLWLCILVKPIIFWNILGVCKMLRLPATTISLTNAEIDAIGLCTGQHTACPTSLLVLPHSRASHRVLDTPHLLRIRKGPARSRDDAVVRPGGTWPLTCSVASSVDDSSILFASDEAPGGLDHDFSPTLDRERDMASLGCSDVTSRKQSSIRDDEKSSAEQSHELQSTRLPESSDRLTPEPSAHLDPQVDMLDTSCAAPQLDGASELPDSSGIVLTQPSSEPYEPATRPTTMMPSEEDDIQIFGAMQRPPSVATSEVLPHEPRYVHRYSLPARIQQLEALHPPSLNDSHQTPVRTCKPYVSRHDPAILAATRGLPSPLDRLVPPSLDRHVGLGSPEVSWVCNLAYRIRSKEGLPERRVRFPDFDGEDDDDDDEQEELQQPSRSRTQGFHMRLRATFPASDRSHDRNASFLRSSQRDIARPDTSSPAQKHENLLNEPETFPGCQPPILTASQRHMTVMTPEQTFLDNYSSSSDICSAAQASFGHHHRLDQVTKTETNAIASGGQGASTSSGTLLFQDLYQQYGISQQDQVAPKMADGLSKRFPRQPRRPIRRSRYSDVARYRATGNSFVISSNSTASESTNTASSHGLGHETSDGHGERSRQSSRSHQSSATSADEDIRRRPMRASMRARRNANQENLDQEAWGRFEEERRARNRLVRGTASALNDAAGEGWENDDTPPRIGRLARFL